MNNIKDFFKNKAGYTQTIIGLVITFFVCFISYNAFIVNGFSSPDGVLEGLHYYINRDWVIAGCGRWFLAFINMCHANLVFPWLVMIECTIINWLSAHTLSKIFKIDNKYYYYIICILFSVLPVFIEIYLYINSAFSYCISILFSILFVYFNLFTDRKMMLISSIFLGMAMGSYQSQIGVAVGLTVMCIIKKILDDEKDIKIFVLKSLINGLLGIVVYVACLSLFLKIYNLELYSRVAEFSLSAIILNFIPRFLDSFRVFFTTFKQGILMRECIYLLIFIMFCIELIIIFINLLSQKEYKSFIVIFILILFLPPLLNIVGIILPKFEITDLMRAPNYIIIPFMLYLLKYLTGSISKIINILLTICLITLSWTYILSANATYDCYRLSYNSYRTQFSNAIDDVLELEDYHLNETKIVVIGVPSDDILRDKIKTYDYAVGLYHNLLYWDMDELDVSTTNIYIINEYGIDPGEMNYEEYIDFINLNACVNMPVWPKEGSVKMVNDCAVIKFGEVYE